MLRKRRLTKRLIKSTSSAFFTIFFGSLILGGCAPANGGQMTGVARYQDPVVETQLRAATERYYACINRAVDHNIRYAPPDDNRFVLQAAMEDCQGALQQLREDVAQVVVKASVADEFIESAQYQSYTVAREGLRRYFENAGSK